MEELVKYISCALIGRDDSVEVTSTEESAKVTVINVAVGKDDIGKLIGRNGQVANSIRTIVKSASAKMGKRFIVKIGERD